MPSKSNSLTTQQISSQDSPLINWLLSPPTTRSSHTRANWTLGSSILKDVIELVMLSPPQWKSEDLMRVVATPAREVHEEVLKMVKRIVYWDGGETAVKSKLGESWYSSHNSQNPRLIYLRPRRHLIYTLKHKTPSYHFRSSPANAIFSLLKKASVKPVIKEVRPREGAGRWCDKREERGSRRKILLMQWAGREEWEDT